MQTIGPKVNLGTTRDDLNLSRVHTGRENERIVAFLCVLPVRVGGGRGGGGRKFRFALRIIVGPRAGYEERGDVFALVWQRLNLNKR